MRKTYGCVNCGEVREIAAHGLCFACYRQKERAKERDLPSVDRHSPGVRREHKKLFRGFTNVMVGLSDLGVSKRDVLTIRKSLEPYLAPISKFLTVKTEGNENTVNSERAVQIPFTVHT
jgi:hypothetical protein